MHVSYGMCVYKRYATTLPSLPKVTKVYTVSILKVIRHERGRHSVYDEFFMQGREEFEMDCVRTKLLPQYKTGSRRLDPAVLKPLYLVGITELADIRQSFH